MVDTQRVATEIVKTPDLVHIFTPGVWYRLINFHRLVRVPLIR